MCVPGPRRFGPRRGVNIGARATLRRCDLLLVGAQALTWLERTAASAPSSARGARLERMTTSARHPLAAREKALYHQVHPAKIGTDVGTTIVSTFLLARHELAAALIVMWVPSVLLSAAFIYWGDFSDVRDSRVGDYLRRYMTPGMQALRFGGEGVVAVGAWLHAWLLIPMGVGVIFWGWFGRAMLARMRRAGALRAR